MAIGMLVSVGLVGFFSGSETAAISTDPALLKQALNQGDPRARRLGMVLANRQKFQSATLVGTNLFTVAATVLSTSLTSRLSLFGRAGMTVTTPIMVVLILLLGEVLPKHLAARDPLAWGFVLGGAMRFSEITLRPLTWLFTGVPRLFGWAIEEQKLFTEASIKAMVSLGEEEGAVESREREMIYGVLESGRKVVRDVMVPRVDMVAVDVDDGMKEARRAIIQNGFSRVPVYEETVDNIIGLVYAKDLLGDGSESTNLKERLRPTLFVPETKRVNDLLKEMRERRIHLAIVLDEYGGTAGVVTVEDLLEEIVGEIHDEYDSDEVEPVIELPDGGWNMDARLPIEEINNELGLSLPSEEYDTLGGLVYSVLERVPLAGEELSLPEVGIAIKVLSLDGHQIERLAVTRISRAVDMRDVQEMI
jgi:CBS domain containing-hemolysin-like protein